MYSIRTAARVEDGFAELSFRHLDSWRGFDFADGPMAGMAAMNVLIGDERCGPMLGFTALPPGPECPLGPSHGHCSDNFRVSVRGVLTMGRERYEPGGFRFQQGWKPYPKNNNSSGAEGGWEMEMFADRRGIIASVIYGGPELEALMTEGSRQLGALFGIEHLLTEPLTDLPGVAALTTTLGPTENSGKLNGSFAASDAWLPLSSATRAVVSLLGEPAVGPVVLLTSTAPGAVAFPAAKLDTEVFRLTVSGHSTIGDRTYEVGDMRVQRASTWAEDVVAGPDGLDEVVVLGDRRAMATAEGDEWLAKLTTIVGDLTAELATREPSPTPVRMGVAAAEADPFA